MATVCPPCMAMRMSYREVLWFQGWVKADPLPELLRRGIGRLFLAPASGPGGAAKAGGRGRAEEVELGAGTKAAMLGMAVLADAAVSW